MNKDQWARTAHAKGASETWKHVNGGLLVRVRHRVLIIWECRYGTQVLGRKVYYPGRRVPRPTKWAYDLVQKHLKEKAR